MPISIYILTTEGPVRIQRVAQEAEGIQSVICLDGRAQALPISARYNAFVRNPTGVVERETGHSAYRVDVDGAIDDGDSWQLGLYLAHITMNTETNRDIHILATGEVDRDLKVRPVGHVSEKLGRAEDLIQRLQTEKAELFIFVPRDAAVSEVGNPAVPVELLDNTDQARVAMNLPKVPLTRVAKHPRKLPLGQLKMAGLVLALVTAWFLWKPMIVWPGIASDGELLRLEGAIAEAERSSLGRLQSGLFLWVQDQRRPLPDALSIMGKLTLSDSPDGCEKAATRKEISWDSDISGDATICKLVVEGDISESKYLVVGRMAYWPDGFGTERKPARTMRGSARKSGRTWTLEFARYPASGSVIRVVALTGPADPRGSQPWFAPLLSEPQTGKTFRDAKLRVMRLGYGVSIKEWQYPAGNAN